MHSDISFLSDSCDSGRRDSSDVHPEYIDIGMLGVYRRLQQWIIERERERDTVGVDDM